MQTAINAELTALGVLWGFRTKDELIANGADYTIEKVEDICGVYNQKLH
jgi:phosphoglycolate phosphatase